MSEPSQNASGSVGAEVLRPEAGAETHDACVSAPRRRWRMGLMGNVLLLVVALVILRFLMIGGVVLPMAQEQFVAVVQAQQLRFAQYIAQFLDERADRLLAVLNRLARLPTDQPFDAQGVQAHVMAQAGSLPPEFAGGVAFVDVYGRPIWQSPHPTAPALPLAVGTEWFAEVVTENRPVIGRPYRFEAGAGATAAPLTEVAVVMAAPIQDATGRPVGVVYAPWVLHHEPAMSALLEGFGHTGGFLVISPRDQMFVTSNRPDKVLTPTPPAGVNPLHDQAMAGYRGVGETVNADGLRELSAMASVLRTGWFVVVRMGRDEALAPFQPLLVSTITMGAVVSFLAIALVVAVIWMLLRPLRRLTREVRAMAEPGAVLRPLHLRGGPEVDDLVQGFNHLIAAVRRHTGALEDANSLLERLSNTDALTGVQNRRYFDAELERLWQEHRLLQRPLALLMLDVDHFKAYNDRYGHQAGDDGLKVIAASIRGAAQRSSDVIARYGGEEFAVILPVPLPAAAAVAERIREAVWGLCAEHADSPFRRVTISVGLAGWTPAAGQSATSLLQAADAALYRSKRLGRNQVSVAERTPGQALSESTPSAL